MSRKIILVLILLFAAAAVSMAVAVPHAVHNPSAVLPAAASTPTAKLEPGYMHVVRGSERDPFIFCPLKDRRLVRLQLILELDKSFTPKDPKRQDPQMVRMHDSLMQLLLSSSSENFSVTGLPDFKARVADTATQILGPSAVRSVYVTGLLLQ